MDKFNQEDVIKALGNLSVLEIIKLTRELEEKWGVKAEPPIQQGNSVCGGCGQSNTGPHACPGRNDVQTEFTVILASVPADKKMAVVKLVRELTSLGLKESKDLVEAAPKVVKESVSAADADELKTKLTAAGAVVEVK